MFDAPNLLDQFSSTLVKEKVDIIEFAESPDFLGRKLYPRQKTLLKILFLMDLDDYDRKVLKEWEADPEIEICPKLDERIVYLKKNGYPHFRVVQLVGGRRSSKGFLTGLSIAYKAYLMTLHDDLHDEFNLPAGKEIFFSIVADSLDQAVEHQFSDAADAALDIKPLQKQRLLGKHLQQSLSTYTPGDLRRVANLRAAGVKVDKDMGSLVIKAHGTNSKTIRGSAALMFIFDEMAHLIAGGSRMSDEQLWKAAIPSVQQFREQGMIFANSSPWTKEGKFFALYEQALALDPPEVGKPEFPDQFMLRFPSWTLYEDWKKFDMPPPPAEPPEDSPIMAFEEKADPESFKVEYRAQFAEVIDAFLRPEMVDRMFDPIFNTETIGYAPEPTTNGILYLRYKGHGDPSSTGANFGIAIGHVESVKNEHGLDEDHVIFDLINAFYPEDFDQNTIDWLQVVPEITHLINVYRPFEFTFDQFDSRMAIQQLIQNLHEKGIGETQVWEKTADAGKNRRRALNFRAALNLGRVHAPHPDTYRGGVKNPIELARQELIRLQEKSGRVDKPSIGPIKTKDIADCIMEVTDALIGDTLHQNQPGLEGAIALGGSAGWSPVSGNTMQFPEFSSWMGKRTPQTPNPARGRSGR
jgi:hypothetical protein